ncbi:MAG: DEAD/DEAH box helicase, partial [Acidimicrobiales bacterium]
MCTYTGVTTLAAAASDLDGVLAGLGTAGRLVHLERIAARDARPAALARPLPPAVQGALGVDGFWCHQVEAIDLARAGRSVAVATGTASGKSLCFRAPIAETTTDPVHPGTALCLFPTKALARDQLRAFAALDLAGLVAAPFDGDCSPDERAWARRHATVVCTNPEMLHHGLLPHHRRWATFLMRLRYVVVDELHAFRGVFGSHVAHLLRRLRRLVALHRSGLRTARTEPTLVACSATIGAPAALAAALWGSPVTAVTDDGSPRGERLVALWQPPLLDGGHAVAPRLAPTSPPVAAERAGTAVLDDGHDTGRAPTRWSSGPTRGSAHVETALVLAGLVEAGHRVIAFVRSRRGVELVAADARRRLPAAQAGTVRPYRGGYLPAERREIEAELHGAALRGVVTTNALELGVDIGGLDACVLDGFPGTIASFWQQAGRAGRERRQSLAVLVAGDDQLDQWLVAHPGELFTRAPEPAVVNLANPYVLHPHLRCAAFEAPLTHDDERWWSGLLDDGIRDLVAAGVLQVRRPFGRSRSPSAVVATPGYPADGVGLRSGSGREVRITAVDGTPVGTVDASRAPELVHQGAVYLHQGAAFRVLELDLAGRRAMVVADPGVEHTMARTDVTVRMGAPEASRAVGGLTLALGAVEIESRVVGYQRRDARSGEVLGTAALEVAPTRLVTRGAWWTVPGDLLDAAGLHPDRWPGTLHAVEHAAIGILPLFAICDRWDVGGVSTVALEGGGAGTIVVHDAYPGGAGIAELAYAAADRHLAATLEVIETCPCTAGCPSCVQSPKCGNWNDPLDKAGAVSLLRKALA